MLFERFFIGLYDTASATFGNVGFFDVMSPPPRAGIPNTMLTFDEVCEAVTATYDLRNAPKFVWADGTAALPAPPDVEPDDDVA